MNNTISKSLYRINRTLGHRLTVYATKETQTKSLCYNFNQKWYNNPHTPSLLQKIGVNRTVNQKEKAKLGNLASGVKTKLMELETGGPVLYWVGILGKGTYRMGWRFTYCVLLMRSHHFHNFSIELTRRATALGS